MNLSLSEFGHRVKTYRTAKKISRAALAEAAGCSKRHLENIESGRANATVSLVYSLAVALGVTTSMLLGDVNNEHSFQKMTDEELVAYFRSASAADKAKFKAIAQIMFAQELDDIPLIT